MRGVGGHGLFVGFHKWGDPGLNKIYRWFWGSKVGLKENQGWYPSLQGIFQGVVLWVNCNVRLLGTST